MDAVKVCSNKLLNTRIVGFYLPIDFSDNIHGHTCRSMGIHMEPPNISICWELPPSCNSPKRKVVGGPYSIKRLIIYNCYRSGAEPNLYGAEPPTHPEQQTGPKKCVEYSGYITSQQILNNQCLKFTQGFICNQVCF